jgi:small ligand-binding sensory domain FIST
MRPLRVGAYLVGGLYLMLPQSASRDGAGDDAGGSEGIAGLMLAPGRCATGLTQGCVPVRPVHRIDEARDNVLMVVDGRPALAVFCEDIGPELTADLRRVGGLIFAGLPVAGSDTGVISSATSWQSTPGAGWLVLGAEVAVGDSILFCRRDPKRSARHEPDSPPACRTAERAAKAGGMSAASPAGPRCLAMPAWKPVSSARGWVIFR